MGLKGLYAGLMAYDLVRAVVLDAALKSAISPLRPSFARSRRSRFALAAASFFPTGAASRQAFISAWPGRLDDISHFRLPDRKKPRPSEPRRTRHKRGPFPKLTGSRAAARAELQVSRAKC